MKKIIFKRTVAVIFVLVLLCLAVLPCFAAGVSFDYAPYTTTYDGNSFDTGASPYPFNSLYEMILEYHNLVPSTYYFELQNTIEGGNSYAPDHISWRVPYSFDQEGYGVGNPIYKLYLPYNNNSSNNSWNFEIRTVLGNVIFASNGANMTRDPSNPNRGFYYFEWDRNTLGNDSGWYIYCYNLPPAPSIDSAPTYQININYVYNNVVVANKAVLRTATSDIFTIDVPPIPEYVLDSGFGSYTFNGLLSNVTIQIPVTPYAVKLAQAEQSGYDRGYRQGYEYGFYLGGSTGYEVGYQEGYEHGYDVGFTDGEEWDDGRVNITNPLSFFVEPVTDFLNIQVVPGLNLSLLLFVFITFSIVIIVLKLFMGG